MACVLAEPVWYLSPCQLEGDTKSNLGDVSVVLPSPDLSGI